MKVLIDAMRDGMDSELEKHGYESYSIKKLIEKGEKLVSDYSVIKYAEKHNMVLVTEDIDNIKGCKENNLECVQFGQEQTLSYLLDELEKIKKSRSGSAKFGQKCKELKSDFLTAVYKENAFGKPKTWLYCMIAGISIVLIGQAGVLLAQNTMPTYSQSIYSRDLGNFVINVTVGSLDNTATDLMRETERLNVQIDVQSKYPEKAILDYDELLYNAGEQKFSNSEKKEIESNGKITLTRQIALEGSGINQLEMKFQFNKETTLPTGGVLTYEPPSINETYIIHTERAYTQSEYDYRVERYYLYQYLWIAAIPIVLVSIKSFKDIIEDK